MLAHGTSVQLDCLVAQVVPVGSGGAVVFGVYRASAQPATIGSAALVCSVTINDDDFRAAFDGDRWTVEWK